MDNINLFLPWLGNFRNMITRNNVLFLLSLELELISGWAKSAVCEKVLHDHSLFLERNHRNEVLKRDGPDELVLPPTTRPEDMKEIVNSMDEAIKSPGTDDEKQAPFFDTPDQLTF